MRAVLYLRVSTGRQAEGEVSIPSQRDLATRYCVSQGWTVVQEYVEPGASATDDRRPVFQAMLERARDPDKPFDVIVVHSFSRFYRNGAEMELTIRRLRKSGVEVVSTTQPTGADPSQEMMRQIIGIFDEYTSKENGKNVMRAMKENAAQGFWNGATPPLGYRLCEAEQRGSKLKKKLQIDPVEAELVQLMFRLYADGDPATDTAPLGIKSLCSWLNRNGYRTKKGGTFGIASVGRILRNTVYIGRWKFNEFDSKTRERKPASEVVEIAVPAIIEQPLFDRVAARLTEHAPRFTPPRIVNAPTLLTGLARCAHCGGNMMLRTGTSSTGKLYTYYSCSRRTLKGAGECKGNSIRQELLDDKVKEAVREKLFTADRLADLLSTLAERREARSAAVSKRLVGLQSEVSTKSQMLGRLYDSIAAGILDLNDPQLSERIANLKCERDAAQAALDRAIEQNAGVVTLDPAKLHRFSDLMMSTLCGGETAALRDYLRAVIDHIVVGNHAIRIIGSKETLARAVAGEQARANVRSFEPKWRTRQDSNL